MHAPRCRVRTSRRTVRRRGLRFSICGVAKVAPKKEAADGIPSTALMCVAFAICAIVMVRFSPVLPPSDPTAGLLVSRHTIDDFANAIR
jgi:hypothetical protein